MYDYRRSPLNHVVLPRSALALHRCFMPVPERRGQLPAAAVCAGRGSVDALLPPLPPLHLRWHLHLHLLEHWLNTAAFSHPERTVGRRFCRKRVFARRVSGQPGASSATARLELGPPVARGVHGQLDQEPVEPRVVRR